MKKVFYAIAVATLLVSCGQSEEEKKAVEQKHEELKKEVEETTDDLFDSLEEDTQEEEH